MSDEEWDVTLEDLEEESETPTVGTDLSLVSLLQEAVSDLLTKSAAQLLVLLITVSLATIVVTHTLAVESIQYLHAALPTTNTAQLPATATFPLAIDVPPAAATILLVVFLVLPFVSEALRIVSIRVFYEGASDGIPRELATRNLATSVFRGWLGGALLSIAVSLGMILIIPGIFLAVAMLFYHQEVAIADESITGAFSQSWHRTKGHRLGLLGVSAVIVTFAVFIFTFTLSFPAASPVGPLGSALLSPLTTLFSIALVTAAYRELREPTDVDS